MHPIISLDFTKGDMNDLSDVQNVQQKLEALLKDQASDIRERRKATLREFKNGLHQLKSSLHTPESDRPSFPQLTSDIKRLAEELRAQLADWAEQNNYAHHSDSLLRATEHLEEEINIPQQEERFTSAEDDGLVVRAGKGMKRLSRGIGRQRTRVANVFRKLSGNQAAEPVAWVQAIPFRSFTQFHLLQALSVTHVWYHKDIRQLFLCIKQIEEWCSSWYPEQENESEETETADKALYEALQDPQKLKGQLEDILETRINAIEDRIGEIDTEIAQWQEKVYAKSVKALQKTGTIEQRGRNYQERRIQTVMQRNRDISESDQKEWNNCLQTYLEEIRMFYELYGYVTDGQLKTVTFRQYLDDQLNKMYAVVFDEIANELEAIQHTYQEKEDETLDPDFAQKVHALKKDLEKKVQQQLLHPLQKGNGHAAIKNRLQNLITDIQFGVNHFSDQIELIFLESEEPDPPEFETYTIEWRAIISRFVKEQIIRDLDSLLPEIEKMREQTLKAGNDVKEIIELNLESAIDADENIEVEDEETLDVITEGLDRASNKLAEARGLVREFKEKIESTIQTSVSLNILDLITRAQQNKLSDLHWKDKELYVREKAFDWKTRLVARHARIQDFVIARFKWLKKVFNTYYRIVAGWMGYELEEGLSNDQQRADVATYLSETDRKIESLPYIYRKIFNFQPIIDERFYTASPENFRVFEQAHENWKKGYPQNVAVMGEKGSGKTTFIQFLEKRYFDNDPKIELNISETIASEHKLLTLLADQLNVPSPSDRDDLIRSINQLEERTVCFIEGIQNLFLRSIRGFEAMESFLLIMAETREQIFWITSCSRYAWDFLNKVLNIRDYYSYLLQTDGLREDQIEKLILDRHKVSGYNLVFEPNEMLKNSRSFKKIMDDREEVQQYLHNIYFEKLTELSDGNATIAMLFWLRSVREFDDTNFYIAPLEILQFEMIEDLRPDTLFTLAAIVIHDFLKTGELSEVLHQDDQRSRLIVSRLQANGLLKQKDGQFQLNQLIYRQVLWVLKQQNIIH